MTVKRKRIKCIIPGIVAGITFFVMSIPAFAAQCEISIELEEFQNVDSDRTDVTVDLYRVGNVDEYGEPKLEEKYFIGKYPQDGNSLDEAAKKIASLVEEKTASERTDNQGVASFDVEQGVYLVCVRGEEGYGQVSPFLVNLPYYENINGEIQGPVYNVNVKPKASPPDNNNPSEPPEKPEEETPNEVQTGDDTQWEIYFVIAILAAAAGVISFYNGRRCR